VLVRLDNHNVTEKDLDEVYATTDERNRPALGFRMNQPGRDTLGAFTREHLPEGGGVFKHQLAVIINGRVIAAPVINSEVRDGGLISKGGSGFKQEELRKLIAEMTEPVIVPDVR
jgi:preprotein translocase subunit SecD